MLIVCMVYLTVSCVFDVIADENDSTEQSKSKQAPAIAPKPRPWSMVNSEAKSGDLSLLSDGSSPNNSTGNTPDSAEALDSSESSSIDRRIAKDIKLKRGGKCFLFQVILFYVCFGIASS